MSSPAAPHADGRHGAGEWKSSLWLCGADFAGLGVGGDTCDARCGDSNGAYHSITRIGIAGTAVVGSAIACNFALHPY